MAQLSISERRIRYARMAGAIFGREPTWYEPTREGFKAFWRHARVYERLPRGSNHRRRTLLPPVLKTWVGRGPGIRSMGHVWPDRVRNLDEDVKTWQFRYQWLTCTALKHPAFRDERGTFIL